MNEILIADGKGRLALRGPYFHLFWAPESQVDADDALASIEAMRSLGGTARPLLLEISGVTLSNAARAAFAHAQPASGVAMLGSSVVDTVMGRAHRRRAQPARLLHLRGRSPGVAGQPRGTTRRRRPLSRTQED